ncbi:MAG: hypothetical protein LQ350_005536 [Teloschistes chrysophthalmus]|nr:MAG: hypothetical protein LQ350_005536 [Niorma chrysophthalma]
MADIETAKRNAAKKAVADHFDPSARYVGIGSGSTIVYVVEAIKALKDERVFRINYVPTGYQSRQVIYNAGLQDIKFDSLPPGAVIDIAFDGADEVDEDLNCIKGGGACLYQEKLVATHARKFICVADHRKLQPRLLTHWPTIPIEVEPLAARSVLTTLRHTLGSPSPTIRPGTMTKTGPVKTDQDNYIIDAPFKPLRLPRDIHASNALHPTHEGVQGTGEDGVWEVERLAREIKGIEGVLSVGLFCGVDGEEVERRGGRSGGQKPVAAYFGMEDGGVVVRRAGEGERRVDV